MHLIKCLLLSSKIGRVLLNNQLLYRMICVHQKLQNGQFWTEIHESKNKRWAFLLSVECHDKDGQVQLGASIPPPSNLVGIHSSRPLASLSFSRLPQNPARKSGSAFSINQSINLLGNKGPKATYKSQYTI